ncbi:hypothetical protein [Clostridium oryzae]|uniref:Uncharacterized protein n=1 Tax=Clostridium oryzae TaxID=1450648 RepID=A0A1V4I871_9CLOT|nr:hypothetical protein [Clostridium oryzae]OPJ56178.1 hypothetical protein CLORY_42950 [Clostridium oryzae]
MKNKENNGLGLPIVSLCIIQLSLWIIASVSTIIAILFRESLDRNLAYMGYKSKPVLESVIYLIMYLLIILSIKFILSKNLLGVLSYFIVSIAAFIYSIIADGFKIDTILPVVFPILMIVFIFNKKGRK